MSLYRKYDLVMIISAFRTKFHEEFYCAKEKRSILEDIFYIVEDPISVMESWKKAIRLYFTLRTEFRLHQKTFVFLTELNRYIILSHQLIQSWTNKFFYFMIL